MALASDDWPQLERDVSRLLEAAPDHPELLDLLGHALLMQGKAAQGYGYGTGRFRDRQTKAPSNGGGRTAGLAHK